MCQICMCVRVFTHTPPTHFFPNIPSWTLFYTQTVLNLRLEFSMFDLSYRWKKNIHLNAVIFIAVWYFHKSFPTTVRWQKGRVRCPSLAEGERKRRTARHALEVEQVGQTHEKRHSVDDGSKPVNQIKKCKSLLAIVQHHWHAPWVSVVGLRALRWLCPPGYVGESGGLCIVYPGDWSSGMVAWTGLWPWLLPDLVAVSLHLSLLKHTMNTFPSREPWSPSVYKTIFSPLESTNFVNLGNSPKFYDFIQL